MKYKLPKEEKDRRRSAYMRGYQAARDGVPGLVDSGLLIYQGEDYYWDCGWKKWHKEQEPPPPRQLTEEELLQARVEKLEQQVTALEHYLKWKFGDSAREALSHD